MIELALTWVQQEVQVSFERQWKSINSIYKGGEAGDDVVPFPIDAAMLQNEPLTEREFKGPETTKSDERNEARGRATLPETLSPAGLLRATRGDPTSDSPSIDLLSEGLVSLLFVGLNLGKTEHKTRNQADKEAKQAAGLSFRK